jgi:hypothetical protein
MYVSGQLHDPVALWARKYAPETNGYEYECGPVGLDAVAKREIPGLPASKWSLYKPSYHQP